MRLVTFENPLKQPRAGAVTRDGRIVDLNLAYVAYLAQEATVSTAHALADALVPPHMPGIFARAAATNFEAARQAVEFINERGNTHGPAGEPLVFTRDQVKLKAPIVPRKFFHTAGNFREHHEEAQKAGFSHPVLPWIVFFQNVDAIIGPDEPVIYPQHLTEELDYELELAVVLKRPGKHFGPEEARDYVGGYVIFNDVTARDVQRREMKSGVF